MFILKSADGTVRYLVGKSEFIVGRRDCDIIINNDNSISRKHAILTIKNDELLMKDLGSKYGTFLDTIKLEKDAAAVVIEHSQQIKFGIFESTYTVEIMKILATTSNLKGSEKASVTKNIKYLGGTIIDSWKPNCTVLTVKEILLTPKVLCALVQGIPIVTPKYWEDFITCVKQNQPPPDVKNYVPPCVEAIISNKNFSLEYRPERRELFKNKIFVFLNNTMRNQMRELISAAGGQSVAFTTNPITPETLTNSSSEYVILHDGSDYSQNLEFNTVIEHIKKEGKRIIPIQELAVAIIECSCEKNCNPSFKKLEQIMGDSPKCVLTENITVPATQTQDFNALQKTNVPDIIIPASLEKDFSMPLVEKNVEKEKPNPKKREGEDIDKISAQNVAKQSKINEGGDVHFIEPTATSSTLSKPNPFLKMRTASSATKNTSTISSTTQQKDKPNAFFNLVKRQTSQMPATSSTSEGNLSAKRKFMETFSTLPSTSKSETPFKTRRIESSTPIPEKENRMDTMNVSRVHHVSTQDEENYPWLDETVQTKVKSEFNKSEDDPQLKEFVESFKNCVVVKVKALLASRKDISNVSNIMECTNGARVNFKKFKKVAPMKPQVTIIPRSDLQKVGFTTSA